jgi:hypothetical protein
MRGMDAKESKTLLRFAFDVMMFSQMPLEKSGMLETLK